MDGTTSKDDEHQTEHHVDENIIEENILSIIAKIKKDRNRACFQNIHDFINRRGISATMEDIKRVLDKLVHGNVIVNKGKDGKESFFVIDIKSDNGDMPNNRTLEDEKNELSNSGTAVDEFINNKNYETLLNSIKCEVKLAVNTELNFLGITSKTISLNNKVISNDSKDVFKNINDLLLKTLNNEISFLRQELASKDKIIEMLITDRKSVKVLENKSALNESNDVSKNVSVESRVEFGNKQGGDNKHDENIRKDATTFETVNKKKSKRRSTTVIGDSIIKDIKAYKMKFALPNERIYIKSFPGATINCMKDYIKPSLKYEPDKIIIHVGTNDLRTGKNPMEIAEEITKLAIDTKTDENEVTISGITTRNDELNDKGMKVNDFLKIK